MSSEFAESASPHSSEILQKSHIGRVHAVSSGMHTPLPHKAPAIIVTPAAEEPGHGNQSITVKPQKTAREYLRVPLNRWARKRPSDQILISHPPSVITANPNFQKDAPPPRPATDGSLHADHPPSIGVTQPLDAIRDLYQAFFQPTPAACKRAPSPRLPTHPAAKERQKFIHSLPTGNSIPRWMEEIIHGKDAEPKGYHGSMANIQAGNRLVDFSALNVLPRSEPGSAAGAWDNKMPATQPISQAPRSQQELMEEISKANSRGQEGAVVDLDAERTAGLSELPQQRTFDGLLVNDGNNMADYRTLERLGLIPFPPTPSIFSFSSMGQLPYPPLLNMIPSTLLPSASLPTLFDSSLISPPMGASGSFPAPTPGCPAPPPPAISTREFGTQCGLGLNFEVLHRLLAPTSEQLAAVSSSIPSESLPFNQTVLPPAEVTPIKTTIPAADDDFQRALDALDYPVPSTSLPAPGPLKSLERRFAPPPKGSSTNIRHPAVQLLPPSFPRAPAPSSSSTTPPNSTIKSPEPQSRKRPFPYDSSGEIISSDSPKPTSSSNRGVLTPSPSSSVAIHAALLARQGVLAPIPAVVYSCAPSRPVLPAPLSKQHKSEPNLEATFSPQEGSKPNSLPSTPAFPVEKSSPQTKESNGLQFKDNGCLANAAISVHPNRRRLPAGLGKIIKKPRQMWLHDGFLFQQKQPSGTASNGVMMYTCIARRKGCKAAGQRAAPHGEFHLTEHHDHFATQENVQLYEAFKREQAEYERLLDATPSEVKAITSSQSQPTRTDPSLPTHAIPIAPAPTTNNGRTTTFDYERMVRFINNPLRM